MNQEKSFLVGVAFAVASSTAFAQYSGQQQTIRQQQQINQQQQFQQQGRQLEFEMNRARIQQETQRARDASRPSSSYGSGSSGSYNSGGGSSPSSSASTASTSTSGGRPESYVDVRDEAAKTLRDAFAKAGAANNACTADVALSFTSATSILNLITGPGTSDACYQSCKGVARVGSMACAADKAPTESAKATQYRQAIGQSFRVPLAPRCACDARLHASLGSFLEPRAMEHDRITSQSAPRAMASAAAPGTPVSPPASRPAVSAPAAAAVIATPESDPRSLNAPDANAVGNKLREKRDFKASIPFFQQAVQLEPHVVGYQWNLADALQKSGDASAAVPHWEKIVALAPKEFFYREQLAEVLAQANRRDDARRVADEALAIAPDSVKPVVQKWHAALLAKLQAETK